ncbi:30S ribosomal protein S6 [Acinetobacter sp.]|uniref:30S ribosomal protein S6 n=1 Tax=Acinetobacter sp. TaxID=472 RepID=UPI0025BABA0B|nr:30S ribosomal protein S6 [Acinetobacter sp.]
MRKYELVVLLHPDLEIDVDTPITKIESIITNAGGTVTKKDNWGKRKLAYKIRKQDFAVYVCFDLMVEPAKVAKIENDILLTEEIMRHIIVATTATEPVAEDKKDEKKTDKKEVKEEVEEKEGK